MLVFGLKYAVSGFEAVWQTLTSFVASCTVSVSNISSISCLAWLSNNARISTGSEIAMAVVKRSSRDNYFFQRGPISICS